MKEYVGERGVRGNGLEWVRKVCGAAGTLDGMDVEAWRERAAEGG